MKWLDALALRYLTWRRKSVIGNVTIRHGIEIVGSDQELFISGNTFIP